MMDEINKEIIKKKVGPKLHNTEEYIGCLLWMDDVALITDNHKDLQEMLNITCHVANKYHIEFGMAKSKILKIGKTKVNHLYPWERTNWNTYKHINIWAKP